MSWRPRVSASTARSKLVPVHRKSPILGVLSLRTVADKHDLGGHGTRLGLATVPTAGRDTLATCWPSLTLPPTEGLFIGGDQQPEEVRGA